MPARHAPPASILPIVGLLLLLMWLGVAGWSYAERERVIAAQGAELDKLTLAVTQQSLRLFKLNEASIVAAAAWIADHPEAHPAVTPAFFDLTARLQQVSDGALEFRVIDPQGNLYPVPSERLVAVANVAEHEDIRVQLDPATRGLFIGRPLESRINHQWIVPVTYPILNPDGSLRLILAAVFELDRMTRIFEPQRSKPNGSITLLRRDGVTLFRTPAIPGAIGKSIAQAPDFIAHLSVRERGQYRVKGAFDGVDRLVSHLRLTDYPLIVAVTTSVDDALIPWRRETLRAVIAFALVTLGGLFLSGRYQRLENRARQQLSDSERRFRSLIEHAPEAILLFDPGLGQVIDANPQAESLFGRDRAALLALHPSAVFVPAEGEADALIARARAGESVLTEAMIARADGDAVAVDVRLDDMPEGERALVRSSFVDIGARKRVEADLRIAATTFESHEGMLVADARVRIVRVNHAFSRITGFAAEDIVGHGPNVLSVPRHDAAFYADLWQTIDTAGAWHGEIWLPRKGGDAFPVWMQITAVKNPEGTITHYVGTFSDISRRKADEERINQLAYFDPLTGLPNRRLFMDRLAQSLASCRRREMTGALMLLDLDNFKTLNDTYGHAAGDRFLIEVTARLMRAVRSSDTVARLGGDEFVLILENLEAGPLAAAQAEAVAVKVMTELNRPFVLEHGSGVAQAHLVHHCTSSVGIVLFADATISVDELIQRADTAMYQAKAAGRNALRFFDPRMQAALAERAALERDLRHGLQAGQLVVHYQPQIRAGGQLTGVEALVRWQHPTQGLLDPDRFIPLAEETGLILALGHQVLETACTHLRSWADQERHRHLTVAVNVSVRQFRHRNFVDQVSAVIDTTGIDPRRLKLELTESLLVDDVDDTVTKMNALKAIGVRFALDDFGTGYSSLAYLKRLPLDQLKIDKSFVRDVLDDSNDAAIARTIIALAHSMGLAVIAEGVETEGQRDFLASHGCLEYQGYLFARPGPAEMLAEFMTDASAG